jgi:hypothetical protein
MNLPPSAAEPAPSSSAPSSSAPSSSAPSSSAQRRNWPRLLVNVAVTLVVVAVAAATFVLSYAGVHAIALQGGVSVQLARIYPGLFDALLVIACVAAVVLRDGRWWARCWAWLVVIVVLGAIGTTDVLHAMNYALRHRPTEGVVAAAPVAAVLLAFSLLLTMLRQTRPRASDAPLSATAVDGVPVLAAAVPRPPAALPPAPAAEAADEPAAYADQGSEASPAIEETQLMPAYRGDVGEPTEAGQHLPDPDAAPTREETEPSPPTEPNEAAAPEAPSSPDPADTSAEPSTARTQAPQAIRYASSAAAESAAETWESEVDPDLAGQVYPVLTSDPDIDTSGYPDEPQDVDDTDAPPFATAPFASVPRLNRVRVTPIPPNESDDEDEDEG